VVLSAVFGGVTGFIAGSQAEVSGYDPNAFAAGASFLFALACIALAIQSMRLRWMRRSLRRVALHNETLADRNWELKEAEEHARRLFESQDDLIVLRDSAGTIVHVNDAYCTLAGRTREALIGSGFTLEVVAQSAVTLEPNGTRTFDQKIAAAAGERWIAWRESLVRSNAGEDAETRCVGRDVTIRAETERALAQARDFADAASRAKSRLLAMASHEMRTPLNGIIGMSALLLETGLSAEQATYARAVKTSGDALLSLVEELLDDSAIGADRVELSSRPFDLATLVEDITELMAPRAQARGIEIACFVDDGLPSKVTGDAARLRQVLLNLAGNAIKFTEQGGVALIVEPGEAQGEICFVVRDTGIGVAPNSQARIFQEFEQADPGIARRYGGTGLGLSISQRIVTQMGGRMSLQSEPGRGSTFTVTVPLAAADRQSRGEAASIIPDLAARSVMLVAPQPIEASLIDRRLQRWGAQTCMVADADAARVLLPERRWHTVLIDHAIGTDDAVALATFARQHAEHRIVMLTPTARHELLPNLSSPFTGYLIKPLRMVSLAARLNPAVATVAPGSPRPQSRREDTARNSDTEPVRGLSILVAEDNEINALLIRAMLTRLGHNAVITSDGARAVDAWSAAKRAAEDFDLVLMDVQMPVLDGLEAARQIRANERGARTPILALTANTLGEDREACCAAGMDGFLVKPLDRDALDEAIRIAAAARSIAA
jgi:PAS domain S-box-containing protein